MTEHKFTENDFYRAIEPQLFSVLDSNAVLHKHVSFNKLKNGSSITFRSSVIANVYFGTRTNWLKLPIKYKRLIPAPTLEEAEVKDSVIKFALASPSDSLMFADIIAAALDAEIDSFPREWSCCSRYRECSAANQCVHPDKDFALNCSYKVNLKHGRNYY